MPPKRRRASTKSSKAETVSKSIKLASDDIDIGRFSKDRCATWFNKYINNDSPDSLDIEGSKNFIKDLGISDDSILILILAYKLEAPCMGVFVKDKWIDGMRELDADSPTKLKEKLPQLEEEFKDPNVFRDLYKYAFGFARTNDQKSLDVATAIAMWKWILDDKLPHLQTFANFLEEKTPVNIINKDQWINFYEFCTTVNQDLSNHDEVSAWPVVIDDYVEWLREKEGMKVDRPTED